jgi:general secretion pathway protein L
LASAPALLGGTAHAFGAVPLLAEPAVAELAERVLGRAPEIQAQAQSLLESARTDWELAQFDLSISGGGRLARRWAQRWQQFLNAGRWRPARLGLVTLLVANLIGLNAWAWHLEAIESMKRAQVRALLVQTFPRVRTIVDAPLQMERELALLRQSSGVPERRDMEVVLGAVGAVLPPGPVPSGIEYSAGEAVVRGIGLDASQVSLVSGSLASQGYSARLDGDRLVVRVAERL